MKQKVLVFILLLFYQNLFSQEFATRLYTPHEGLVQAQVFCVTQGPQGYLWIGTLGGISRFDGLKFKNFTEQDGLLSNAVYNMQWFNDTLYILTKEGVDIMVDNKITNIYHDKNRIFTTGHIKINPKYQYAFGSNYNYSFFLNIRTKTITNFPEKFQIVGHILAATMTDSSFILGKGTDLYEMPFGDTAYRKIFSFNKEVARVNIFNHIIYVIFKSSDNHYSVLQPYYATLTRKEKKFDVAYINSVKNISYDLNGVFDKLFPTKSGITYYCFYYGYLYYKENGKVTKFADNYNFIHMAFEDRNNNVWVATEKGLLKIFTGRFKYYRPKQGFVDNVWAAAGINDSLVIMASFNHGIHLYNNGVEKKYIGSKKEILSCYFGASYGFKNDLLLSVYPGVARYNIDNNRLTIIDKNLKDVNFTLFKDIKHNRILVAQLRSLVAINNDYSTEKLFDVTSIGSNQYIISITVRKDKVLLGLLRGLLEYDPKTNKSRYIVNDKTRFNSLVTDSLNTVWAATSKGLLKILDDTLYYLKGINKPTELTSVIIDNHNKLYASGQTSLYVLNLTKHYQGTQNQLKSFGFNDGYFGESPQQDAFFKDKKGNLWLPTGYNVIKIFPDQLNKPDKELTTTIIRMAVSTGDTSFAPVNINTKIMLKPSENNIAFNFLSVNLQNPERTHYQCTLKTNNRNWSTLTKQRQTEYNNLPYGKYTFTVQASVADNFENAQKTVVTFTILPPLWRKTWFLISVAFVLFLVIALLLWYVKKREEKKNKGKMEILKLKNQALSIQIDNHFIANCTSKIVLLYEAGRIEEGNRYTQTFSKFIQQNLVFLREETIALADEIKMIKNYVDLERIHSRDFEFVVETDKAIALEKIKISPFLIQPIVENAIKHGVKKLPAGQGKMMLKVEKVKNNLLIVIEDNGPGIHHTQTEKREGNRLSLKIVNERIRLLGKGSFVKINSNEHGTKVIIHLINLIK